MKCKYVRLIFDAQFVGRMECEMFVPEWRVSNEQNINDLFLEVLGVEYDKNCSYEVIA